MSTKAAEAAVAAATDSGEQETQSGNITLAELGKRMSKSRKTPSKPAITKPAEAKPDDATSSEQAGAADEENDLSQSAEQDDSAALAAEAQDGDESTEADGAAQDQGEGAGEGGADDAAQEPRPKAEKPVRDLQKRVGKLTEQRDGLREENEELRQRLADLETRTGRGEAKQPDHPGESGFASDRNVRQFDGELKGATAFLQWAGKNPDGGSYEDGGKTYQLTADDVENYKWQTERREKSLLAKREARLEALRTDFDAKRATAHAEAVRLYPWLEQKASAEFQDALLVVRENPDVLNRPDFELVVARQVAGRRLEAEALKKLKPAATAQRPRAGSRPAPVVAHSPSGQASRAGVKTDASAAESEFQQKASGGRVDVNDLSKLLAQRRAARRTAGRG